ncbi:MAG: hypothetical protein WC989_03020 [Micavibrio sp.]
MSLFENRLYPVRPFLRPPVPHKAGSVLVFILIAVALFAALSYAMLREGRAPVSMMGAVQADLAATEIIAYADAIGKAVQKLRIRGCGEEEFDFHNDVWINRGGGLLIPETRNPKRRMDGSCAVFGPAGGLRARMMPDKFLYADPALPTTGTKEGSLVVQRMAMPGVGTDAQDIILFMPYPRKEVCLKINEKMGIPDIGGDSPKHEREAVGNYNGSWDGDRHLVDTDGVLAGKRTMCTIDAIDTLPHAYRFFHVLLAR